jgi:hypothetical protein
MVDFGAGLSYLSALAGNPYIKILSMQSVGQMKEMLKFEQENNMFKAHRTLCMQTVFQDLNDKKIELPINCDDFHEDIQRGGHLLRLDGNVPPKDELFLSLVALQEVVTTDMSLPGMGLILLRLSG